MLSLLRDLLTIVCSFAYTVYRVRKKEVHPRSSALAQSNEEGYFGGG